MDEFRLVMVSLIIFVRPDNHPIISAPTPAARHQESLLLRKRQIGPRACQKLLDLAFRGRCEQVAERFQIMDGFNQEFAGAWLDIIIEQWMWFPQASRVFAGLGAQTTNRGLVFLTRIGRFSSGGSLPFRDPHLRVIADRQPMQVVVIVTNLGAGGKLNESVQTQLELASRNPDSSGCGYAALKSMKAQGV